MDGAVFLYIIWVLLMALSAVILWAALRTSH